MNKNILLKVILFTCILLWMFVIYSFSDVKGTLSSDKSRELINDTITKTVDAGENIGIIKEEIPKKNINNMSRKINYPFRKTMHVIEYFILSILIISFLRTINYHNYYKYLITFFICFLYAYGDEVHQLFVGRTGSLKDILIDMTGVILAISLYLIFSKFNNKLVSNN